ncbi:HAMP domain-containing sensor histidine kinase [Streptomyces sp. NPDC021356]|uniref:HAMP domain-containing sensor histidine kinase n=1 Tax=Streptomyces sp. NPDC021356 TaxID=3154900 RepID=UPI0033C94DC2
MDTLRALLDWRSLRWRIALLVAVACCAVALTIGLLVHGSTRDRSLHEGEVKARNALSLALERYERDGVPQDGDVTDADVMPDELLRRLTDRRADDPAATWYDGNQVRPRMWAALQYRGQPYAVEVDMTLDLLSRKALDRHMWKYSLLALAVVVPLSALAAELPHRRLRRVARTARRISAGDLHARTAAGRGGDGGRGDEITEISATVDAMADSLRDRLETEQRFTADVAHELRTPLMGLVTASGLLPEGEASELVRDRVGVLRTLVEDLLEISRLDAGAERAESRPVPLDEVVADSLARTGLAARFTADAVAPVETDPRRLDRIVANLVVNAHRHGRAPVEVTVSGPTVTVRDHGDGFPEELLTHGPQRFRTGAAERGRGHGLGLTIALGQARVIGASLDFADAPGGGAMATLRLPAAALT